MECNKDEAKRAKQIAEEKLQDRDIIGAKKFALKAQNLCPGLEGLSQFIDVIDVYISDEKKLNGETNYYAISGVDPQSSVDLMKKQYMRRALALHPDKNKSIGTDGAFMLLSQAWSVLRDDNQRHEYDLRVNTRAPSMTTGGAHTRPPMTPGQNYSFPQQNVRSQNYPHFVPIIPRPRGPFPYAAPPFSNTSTAHHIPVMKPHAYHNYTLPVRNVKPSSSSRPSTAQTTFWTCCSRCKIRYEYDRVYLNKTLLCPRCQQPFLATEMHGPSVSQRSESARPSPYSEQQQGVFSTSNGHTSGQSSAEATQCHPSSESLKRKHEDAVNIPMDNEALDKNKSSPKKVEAGDTSRGLNKEKPDKRRRSDVDEVSPGASRNNAGLKRTFGSVKPNVRTEHESSSMKELSPVCVRRMLLQKGKMETSKLRNHCESLRPKSSETNKVDTKRPMNASEVTDKKTVESSIDQNVTSEETVLMDVPDANFHNFDEDSVEGSFSESQVWAAYDNDDGMPRYYSLVQKVLSREPFKMQISWLNSKSTAEFGDLDWTSYGFTKTSGNFRAGKSILSTTLNSFSHQVKWKKGARGAIQILPTKGDIWAIYRNWSRDWNALTDTETIHTYDVVVVLEDYNEDRGVLVAPLDKVAGFTSVFNQHVDPTGVTTITREEMFRLCHQVPYRKLSGLEGESVPKCCYELDPAALPLELLKVVEKPKDILVYSRRRKEKMVVGNGDDAEKISSFDGR